MACVVYVLFFRMSRRPPRSTLFLYTTLFRSALAGSRRAAASAGGLASGRAGGTGRSAERPGWSAGRLVADRRAATSRDRSEEHTSELQSLTNLVCRLLLEKLNNAHL